METARNIQTLQQAINRIDNRLASEKKRQRAADIHRTG